MSSLEEPIRYRFSSLQGLRSLSLGNVDFYDSGLVDVCSLPRLESLDLSNTSVTNLTPLLGLKERLRSLTLHQLKRLEMSTAQLLGVIGQLDVLQVSEKMELSFVLACLINWNCNTFSVISLRIMIMGLCIINIFLKMGLNSFQNVPS